MMNTHKKICYSLAKSSGDFDSYFRIRENSFREDDRIPNEAGRKNRDDDKSTIILATFENEVIGGARLVTLARKDELPLSRLLQNFAIHLPERYCEENRYSEFGGLALIPELRNGNTSLGLFLFAESICRIQGINSVLFATESRRSRLFKRAYKAAYGNNENPPTIYQDVCEFTPEDQRFQSLGNFSLTHIIFK